MVALGVVGFFGLKTSVEALTGFGGVGAFLLDSPTTALSSFSQSPSCNRT